MNIHSQETTYQLQHKESQRWLQSLTAGNSFHQRDLKVFCIQQLWQKIFPGARAMSWVSWTSLFNRHQILEPKPLCGKFLWQWKLLSCAKLQLRVELVRSNWWSHRNSSGSFLPPIVLEKDRLSCSWCSWHWWQAQWRPGNHLRRSSERLLQLLVQMLSDSIIWLYCIFWPKCEYFQIRRQQPFLGGTLMPAPSSQWKPLLKYKWIKKRALLVGSFG